MLLTFKDFDITNKDKFLYDTISNSNFLGLPKALHSTQIPYKT